MVYHHHQNNNSKDDLKKEATPEQEIEDKHSTIIAHARKNVDGKEPKLSLPSPPAGPSQFFLYSAFGNVLI
jgi:hypothetical protein